MSRTLQSAPSLPALDMQFGAPSHHKNKEIMNRNIPILFATRIIRLFCYGFLSLVLTLYLVATGLSVQQAGLIFAFTLAGDAGITLLLTTHADRFGRKRTLLVGAMLMIGAGAVFLLTQNIALLIAAAIIGVISPSGNEIGPFLSVEQASLSQLISDEKRTQVFAWYNLVGSFATAAGAGIGGWLAHTLQAGGISALASYRIVLEGYSVGGCVLFLLFLILSSAIEVQSKVQQKTTLGLHRSRAVIMRLSMLFAMDAFAGGLIVQSLLVYWFQRNFVVDVELLGRIFAGANVLAGISALLAVPLSKRFGLINTMVFTHIPSNILLMLIPFMPNLPLAIGLLFLRFSISQMDVPTRQSYTMAVVAPDERSAAAGVTAIARSVGASVSPLLAGLFYGSPVLLLSSVPIILCGGIKITYDLLLFRAFSAVRPPEES
jgi:MFS family permease